MSNASDVEKALLRFNTTFIIALIGSASVVHLNILPHAHNINHAPIYLAALVPALFLCVSTFQILVRWSVKILNLRFLDPLPTAIIGFSLVPTGLVYLALPSGKAHGWITIGEVPLYGALFVTLGFFLWVLRKTISVVETRTSMIQGLTRDLNEIADRPDTNCLNVWQSALAQLLDLVGEAGRVSSVQEMITKLPEDRRYGEDPQHTRQTNDGIRKAVKCVVEAHTVARD